MYLPSSVVLSAAPGMNPKHTIYTFSFCSSKIIRFEKMTLVGCSKNGRFRVRESTKTMYARAPRT